MWSLRLPQIPIRSSCRHHLALKAEAEHLRSTCNMDSSYLIPRLDLSLVLTLLAPLLLLVIKLYLQRKKLLRVLRPFPGPPTHWLYGNRMEFDSGKELQKIKEMPKKYPRAFPFWLGPFKVFLHIYDPEYAKILLNRKDPKTKELYKFSSPFIGNGLFILDGEKWHYHRCLLKPAFHFNNLKDYTRLIKDSVCRMLDEWEKLRIEDSSMNIYESIRFMTLDSFLKCSFNVHDSCKNKSFLNIYFQNMEKISNFFSVHMYHLFYQRDFIYKLSSEFQELQALCRELKKQSAKLLQDGMSSLKNPGEQGKIEKKKYLNFLDILLQARDTNGGHLTDEELVDEVNTFMFAGHDTMAAGFSWTLYCLAMNPEHQKKCREEIQGILADGGSINWEHLDQMHYSTKCIKEALRLYSPTSKISRQLSEPITFPDGRSLPAGMVVFLNIWALHYNPAVWENPEVFDPERFSPENKRHSYAHLPFSSGPRNCIGQQFAMTLIKVALALTLLRFELLPDLEKPPIPTFQIIVRSKNGIHLYLKPLH